MPWILNSFWILQLSKHTIQGEKMIIAEFWFYIFSSQKLKMEEHKVKPFSQNS